MNRKVRLNLKEFLSRPVILSLVIWAAASLFIHPGFNKYTVKKASGDVAMQNTRYYYYDLDHDGASESISVDLNDTRQSKVMVRKGDMVLEQFNFKYQAISIGDFFAGDFNNDGVMECFLFTRGNDSILLNVFDPVRTRKVLISNRFIDLTHTADQSADIPTIEPVGIFKNTGRINRDFIFFIKAGFSLRPRRAYRYSPDTDSLIRSPHSSANINGCNAADINDDGLEEFIFNTSATDNTGDTATYSDHFSWLIVLDHNLQYLFPPVKVSKYPAMLMAIPMKLKEQTGLVVLSNYFGSDTIHSTFSLYDRKGNKHYERYAGQIVDPECYISNNPSGGKNTFCLVRNWQCEIDKIDTGFNIVKKFRIPEVIEARPIMKIDADSDGNPEYFFLGRDSKSLIITRSDYSFPAVINLNAENDIPFITKIERPGARPLLYLQFITHGTTISYSRNPLYYFKYPFYAFLYFLVLLVVTIISGVQKYRSDMKLQTERKIAELQMRAIKNQVDPHFTLNILNAIGSLFMSENNKEKADYVFTKYTRLIREAVISSDQVIITLADEIEFVRNYLELEQFRRNNSFTFTIISGSDVNTSVTIPRMLIYTFAENSLKHGAGRRKTGGVLHIEAQVADRKIQIIVSDNGPGINMSESTSGNTGRGLSIVNEMIELYFRLEKSRITYILENVMDTGNAVAGTRALIEIPVKIPKI
jgi:hypothetical protein